MKTLDDIRRSYSAFKSFSGLDLNEINQGEDAWLEAKLGVISASRAKDALLGAKGKRTQVSETYKSELVAQIITKEAPSISGRPLDWGHEHEDAARSIAEFETGIKIEEVPFIFKDDTFRVGASPDGYGDERIEIKCPYNSVHHVNFLTKEIIKPEYIFQVQFSLWVTEADSWIFASYDPRAKVHQFASKIINRDETLMKRFDDEIPIFIGEMDEMLDKLNVKWGYQWTKTT